MEASRIEQFSLSYCLCERLAEKEAESSALKRCAVKTIGAALAAAAAIIDTLVHSILCLFKCIATTVLLPYKLLAHVTKWSYPEEVSYRSVIIHLRAATLSGLHIFTLPLIIMASLDDAKQWTAENSFKPSEVNQQENIFRLHNIIEEKNRTITSLQGRITDTQSREREEQRDLELQYQERQRHLTERIAVLQRDLQNARQHPPQRRETQRQPERRDQANANEIAQRDSEIFVLRRSINELTARISVLEIELRGAREQITIDRNAREEANERASRFERQLHLQRLRLNQEHYNATTEIHRQHQEQIDQLQRQIHDLNIQIDEKNNQIALMQADQTFADGMAAIDNE